MSSASRPPSSASIRPSTSAPIRPSSSASSRSIASRASSASATTSTRRNTVSASRPSSRATQRPPSRLLRPSTRQSTRLNPAYQDLVTHLTGLTPDDDAENFETAVDFVARSLDPTLKPASGISLATVQKHLQGHSQKARINSNDILAEAIDHASQRVTAITSTESDLDADIHNSRIPSHIQFLLALSSPPNNTTIDYAEQFIDRVENPGRPPAGLTWAEILADEPFTGEHWKGVYGLPAGSVKHDEDQSSVASEESLLSLSLLDDDDYDYGLDERSMSSVGGLSDDSSPIETPPTSDANGDINMEQWSKEIAMHSHRSEVEQLQARQYWRNEWRVDPRTITQPFNVGKAATLGPAWRRAQNPSALTENQRYMNEHDAVRELLTALQGRKNMLLSWNNSGQHTLSFTLDTMAPSLLHLTPGAFNSILSSFAALATTVEHLRRFTDSMYEASFKSQETPSSAVNGSSIRPRRTTRTVEAFSEAIGSQIRHIDTWCAQEEENISMAQAGIVPPSVCSLLNLKSRLEDEFADTFAILLGIVRVVVQRATRSPSPILAVWTFHDLPKRMHPAAISAHLLNAIFKEIQHASTMRSDTSLKFLLPVFCESMAPLWNMLHRWLKEGMPIRDGGMGAPSVGYQHSSLDEEFFIEDNELVLLDPDFWSECFVLRDGMADDAGYTSVPDFLVHIAPHALAAGKAIGLLRTLGVPVSMEQESQALLTQWQSFDALLWEPGETTKSPGSLINFPKYVYDKLLPLCQGTAQMLSQMLVQECDVWEHLTAMEDLYLMRRGDVMSNFLDVLFARMDTTLPWTDFHFLNATFADVATAIKWIDPALVRFSYRGHKDKFAARTVRAIEGLQIEYAVPFPLTYIWGPRTLQVYSSVFVFVLQIRRAKTMLDRILVRDALPGFSRHGEEMKMFYAMRGKLSWFINVLLNFVCINVLHAQVLSFHELFKEAKSLDDMINLHNTHLHTLENRCLLQDNTAALHQSIISILDMTIHFSDSFVAFAGDATHDISRHTVTPLKSHRSRRLKRLKRNIIGFSQTIPVRQVENDSSSESDSDADYSSAAAPSFSLGASFVGEGDEFVVRLDTMSSELDTLVRFIRRGVDSLAAGAGEAASAFGMFAFALEDWDQ
ncbi:hypothetical protein BDW22DRAFT_1368198 [Trametopsis cervina]|nr:hypothetical protein BDW22DRAFT_1368198 [Trametopsis cervina]